MMKLSRKRVLVLAAGAVALGLVVVLVCRPGARMDPTTARVRNLLREVREPGLFEHWLIRLELRQSRWRDLGNVEGVSYELALLGEDAVPALIDALKDRDENVRTCAALALGRIGPRAKAAVPALIDAARARRVRSVSVSFLVEALREIGPSAVPALIDALKDGDPNVRLIAVYALGDIGPGAKAAVPGLINAIKDRENPYIPGEAIVALGDIGPGAKAAVPALVDVLKNNWWLEQLKAADALGKIGPEAKAAIPALEKALEKASEEPDALLRDKARRALGKIRGQPDW